MKSDHLILISRLCIIFACCGGIAVPRTVYAAPPAVSAASASSQSGIGDDRESQPHAALESALSDQPRSDAVSLSLSLLPSPPGGVPLLIQSANAPQFRSLILSEWYPFVREGILELPTYRSSRQDFTDDEEWKRQTVSPDFDPAAALSIDVSNLQRGFPFGDKATIGALEPERAAQHLLLNWQARGLHHVFSREHFTVQLSKEGRLVREATFVRERFVPGRVAEAPQSDQAFREIVTFRGPESLAEYRFLTFRFFGDEQDLLWLYSPRLEKVRQLTGSNRGDDMFGLSLSLDDVLVYGEKVELADIQHSELVTGIVPLVDDSLQALEPSGNACVGVSAGQESSALESRATLSDANSFGAGVFHGEIGVRHTGSDFSRWTLSSGFPSSVVFSPRPLRKLYLNPRDPFSPHGRVILYIDDQLQIPVAKVLFDRTGQLSRLVLGAIAQSVQRANGRREPYIRYSSILNVQEGSRAFVKVEANQWCDALPTDFAASTFDPSNLGTHSQ